MLLFGCVFVLFGAFGTFGACEIFCKRKNNKEFKTALMTSLTLLLNAHEGFKYFWLDAFLDGNLL